jgi:hypothetical protein
VNENEIRIIHNTVVGGLRGVINDHGSITKELIGSASKRITGHLKSAFKNMKHSVIYKLDSLSPSIN